MSNPYGNDPYGNQGNQNPYGGAGGASGGAPGGGPPPPPGGGTPYGAYGAPGGGSSAPKTDGVSIAGLVLSLLCCTSLFGMILGFVGLGRTKDGRRKGRGLAIAAIIIGALGTVAGVVGGIAAYQYATSFVSPEEAEVGQCVDIEDVEDDQLTARQKDCDEPHNGEIVYVGEFSEVEDSMPGSSGDLSDSGISRDVCAPLMDPADVELIPDDAEWGFALEDPDNPSSDDPFFCYVRFGDDRSEGIL